MLALITDLLILLLLFFFFFLHKRGIFRLASRLSFLLVQFQRRAILIYLDILNLFRLWY